MIERSILSNIIFNDEFARKILPHVKDDYFTEKKYKAIFHILKRHMLKYNKAPSIEALKIEVSSQEGIPENLYHEMVEEIAEWKHDENADYMWLKDKTEEFCQERALHNAIMNSIDIIDNSAGNLLKGSIPKMLSDALAVSFDTSVGHDYLEDWNERFDFYHTKEDKIPFDIEYFNEITSGGVSKKSLNVVLASTGVGKSLFMCHAAAANLVKGYNVLYITLEMSEKRIAERIDANLLDIPIKELEHMDRSSYARKIEKLRSKTVGKLIIEEFPTASASVLNFRALLDELKTKKNFKPDIIYIDYINICTSSRFKPGSNANSYTIVKAVAEEFRGLGIEYNVPIFTATQTTRAGAGSSDIDITDTSESWGLPQTADFFFALISTDDLQAENKILIKQLKNRYNDLMTFRRFVIGVDRPKMRLYDCEQSAQDNILDGPVFDQTETGKRYEIDKQKFNDLIFS